MVGYNYCSGTKECDACSCGGDKTKCDFYPDIKRKAIYELKGIKTNADKIRNMADEELADYLIKLTEIIRTCDICGSLYIEGDDCNCDCDCKAGVLRWLKTKIK